MSKNIVIFVVALAGLLPLACGSPAPANNSRVSDNSTAGNAGNTLVTTTPTPESTTNNAPTLTPVFKAYCDAMIRKDEAALRRIYSSDTIRNFEEQMKREGIRSLMKFLEDDRIEKICEIRNEQITGDSAIAEIRADWAPNGVKVVFAKENGEWRLTNKAPTFESVRSSNSNTAK
jgi:hypothetical protein